MKTLENTYKRILFISSASFLLLFIEPIAALISLIWVAFVALSAGWADDEGEIGDSFVDVIADIVMFISVIVLLFAPIFAYLGFIISFVVRVSKGFM